MKRMGSICLLAFLIVALVGCSQAPVDTPPAEPVSVAEPPEIQLFSGDHYYDWPAEVEVTYSDGSTAMLPVAWDTFALSSTGIKEDTVLIGTVGDTGLQVEQHIQALDGIICLSEAELAAGDWATQVEQKLQALPVRYYSFSPDRSTLVYGVGSIEVEFFLWREGELAAQPVPLRPDLYWALEWSADGAYFFAIASTDVNVGVDVVDARTNEYCTNLGSFMGAAWSPVSHEILIARMTDVQLVVAAGDGLAYEIAIYDVDTGETKVLVPGEPNSILSIGGWHDANTVGYNREDLITGKKEHLTVTIPR